MRVARRLHGLDERRPSVFFFCGKLQKEYDKIMRMTSLNTGFVNMCHVAFMLKLEDFFFAVTDKMKRPLLPLPNFWSFAA